MWLLLCSSDDYPALWAASRLRARGLSPLVVLTPELLHSSLRWRHRLDGEHPPSVEFTLADGRTICGAEIRGVLNRITWLPPSLVAHVNRADRAYALAEWTALHISWLSALTVPVLNRPVMQGLCGAWRHDSEWYWLASRAGLRTAPFRQAPSMADQSPTTQLGRAFGARTIFVADGRVVAEGLTQETALACAFMARLSNTRLAGDRPRSGDRRIRSRLSTARSASGG